MINLTVSHAFFTVLHPFFRHPVHVQVYGTGHREITVVNINILIKHVNHGNGAEQN